MKIYEGDLKIALTKKDIKQALKELRELGFGRANRTEEHAKAFPLLDRLTFELEDYEN